MRKGGEVVPAALAVAFLAAVAVLACWDVAPWQFPPGAHDGLATAPLILVALTCIGGAVGRGGPRRELLRPAVAALAFLFWAANQWWPESRQATLLNDVAIAGFVLDVVLGFRRPAVERPPVAPGEVDVV